MGIRDSSRIVEFVFLAVVGALVIANVYGFYTMRVEREQLRGAYQADAVVLDINVLAAEMQLRRSDRGRRQFDDRIARMEELLQGLKLGAVQNRQILDQMTRHTNRLAVTFAALESALESDQYTGDQQGRAVRALTRNFLASTTALASLSERLTRKHSEQIERIENYLVILNIGTAVMLLLLLGSISWLIQKKLLSPILDLRARVEGLVEISDADSESRQASKNELEEITLEFDRRVAAVREADAEKERYAKELQRSNKELAQFAYVASHDLRAPLKGIKMTASWVAEDMAEYMNDDTRESLALLQNRAERLDDLLNSLLEYSRVQSKVYEEESVDVADVIADVDLLLGPPDGFTVKVVGNLPQLFAVKVHLQQVFQNLIENAFKHHDHDTGVIAVEAEDLGDVWLFSVTDDGPGIPAQYHEKVLQIFQTLVRRDEREASGMGLALVNKIIEQHGGTLSIDSPLNDRGCAMRFTWPKVRKQYAAA